MDWMQFLLCPGRCSIFTRTKYSVDRVYHMASGVCRSADHQFSLWCGARVVGDGSRGTFGEPPVLRCIRLLLSPFAFILFFLVLQTYHPYLSVCMDCDADMSCMWFVPSNFLGTMRQVVCLPDVLPFHCIDYRPLHTVLCDRQMGGMWRISPAASDMGDGADRAALCRDIRQCL